MKRASMLRRGAAPFDKFLFDAGGVAVSTPPLAERVQGQDVKRRRMQHQRASPSRMETKTGGLDPKLGNNPLRLILVGHNPSDHAWKSGHYYSNPSNRMFKILKETKIAPDVVKGAEDDGLLQSLAGVGFIDVGTGFPGTDSSKFTSEDFVKWSKNFYRNLQDHLDNANATIGCTCGHCGAPAMVAFTGKRQYLELLNVNHGMDKPKPKRKTKVSLGPQDVALLPDGWPFPATTSVWVMTSTSGASALTNTDRIAPYKELAFELQKIPWPRNHDELRKCKQAA
mmetsp:Transcript_6069/g.15455  ORF Transcript_6069/g.15455 Transcript_6069/m.15455 type:complete len:283 (+) Transcript_6069:265-1113(+)